MMKDFKQIHQVYTALKAERLLNVTLWSDISRFVGIGVKTDYEWYNSKSTMSKQLDEYVDDPTSAISVNQFGDYLIGIMWGTGDKAFRLKPSRYVLELADEATMKDYFAFATDQSLYHMNHAEAGFATSLRPYAYDQASFGTSGIGCFLNKSFMMRTADNALIFRNYGVDNMCIDEGKSGQIDTMFATYHWKVNRIIGEFCTVDGAIDDKRLSEMPKAIREAYKKGDVNREFTIVFGFFPRMDYDPKLKGKKGMKYRGVWFLDEGNDNKVFFEESFAEKPVAVARMIRVRGETWGRSSGTMLLSSIRSVNFMLSTTIEILEKMGDPSLGMFNNAIMGDSVLDTSPHGLNIFNSALAAASGGKPTFPLYDVGDPTGIIQFIIPYLNEKITTAFKIDALLDFNSAKDMTATESLQRYAIRGKSLAGLLLQQKIELLEHIVKRSVSVLYNINELGINPRTMQDAAQRLKANKRTRNRVIPDAVLQVMEDGRPWYEIEFNNELEKLTRTEAIQNLVQLMQTIGGIAGMYPDIVGAVDWYKLLKEVNDNLGTKNQILLTEDDFKKAVQASAQQQQAAMMLQGAQGAAAAQKDAAMAGKASAEANNLAVGG